MRLTWNEVLAIARQPDALALHRFVNSEWSRSGCARPEPIALARLLGRHDRSLIHRKQRQKKGKRLIERDIDRVCVVDPDPGESLRFSGMHVGCAAHVQEDPAARRLQFGREQPDEALLNVARLDDASVVETHAATKMESITVPLLEDLPAFRESGRELRAFAVRRERGVDGAGHVSERRRRDVDRIERQLLPENRRRADAAALRGARQAETRQLLVEQRRLVGQRVRHLIEIADADVRLASGLFDDAHRSHDRRAFSAQDGDGLVHPLDERHDVLHRPADRAAAGLLFGRGPLQVFRRVAHRGRLLADLARCLRLLLRGGSRLLDHLRDFLDRAGHRGAAACLLIGRARDLGDGIRGALGELQNFAEDVFGAFGQADAVGDAVGADGHLLRRPADRALHVFDQRANLVGGYRRPLRQIADLIGDNAECLAALSRLRGDDRRIQRQQVRLAGHRIDHPDDLADFFRPLRELTERALRLIDGAFDAAHAFDGAADGVSPFACCLFHRSCELRRLPRGLPDLLGRGIHLHHGARRLNGE